MARSVPSLVLKPRARYSSMSASEPVTARLWMPCLRQYSGGLFHQQARHAPAAESRLYVKVVQHALVPAGKAGEAATDGAQAHGPAQAFRGYEGHPARAHGAYHAGAAHAVRRLAAISSKKLSSRAQNSSMPLARPTVTGASSSGGRSMSGSPCASMPFLAKPKRDQKRSRRSSEQLSSAYFAPFSRPQASSAPAQAAPCRFRETPEKRRTPG